MTHDIRKFMKMMESMSKPLMELDLAPSDQEVADLERDADGRAKHPGITYTPEKNRVGDPQITARVTSYNSQRYTKLAQKIVRIKELSAETKKLEEEVKAAARLDVADLFSATDIVQTRVIETNQFFIELSKNPKATESYKYADIIKELETKLTPELLVVLQDLKKKYKTVTNKSPSLSVTAKESINEGIWDSIRGYFARFKEAIMGWANKYDASLANLKAMAGMTESVVEDDRQGEQQAFDVYQDGNKIDTVFFAKGTSEEDAKYALVCHDDYNSSIKVVKSPDKSEATSESVMFEASNAIEYPLDTEEQETAFFSIFDQYRGNYVSLDDLDVDDELDGNNIEEFADNVVAEINMPSNEMVMDWDVYVFQKDGKFYVLFDQQFNDGPWVEELKVHSEAEAKAMLEKCAANVPVDESDEGGIAPSGGTGDMGAMTAPVEETDMAESVDYGRIERIEKQVDFMARSGRSRAYIVANIGEKMGPEEADYAGEYYNQNHAHHASVEDESMTRMESVSPKKSSVKSLYGHQYIKEDEDEAGDVDGDVDSAGDDSDVSEDDIETDDDKMMTEFQKDMGEPMAYGIGSTVYCGGREGKLMGTVPGKPDTWLVELPNGQSDAFPKGTTTTKKPSFFKKAFHAVVGESTGDSVSSQVEAFMKRFINEGHEMFDDSEYENLADVNDEVIVRYLLQKSVGAQDIKLKTGYEEDLYVVSFTFKVNGKSYSGRFCGDAGMYYCHAV